MSDPTQTKLSAHVISMAVYPTRNIDTKQAWRDAARELIDVIDEAGGSPSGPHLQTLQRVTVMALTRQETGLLVESNMLENA